MLKRIADKHGLELQGNVCAYATKHHPADQARAVAFYLRKHHGSRRRQRKSPAGAGLSWLSRRRGSGGDRSPRREGRGSGPGRTAACLWSKSPIRFPTRAEAIGCTPRKRKAPPVRGVAGNAAGCDLCFRGTPSPAN
jgi:hypothetical protein